MKKASQKKLRVTLLVVLLVAGTFYLSRNVADGVEYRYDMDTNLIEVIK